MSILYVVYIHKESNMLKRISIISIILLLVLHVESRNLRKNFVKVKGTHFMMHGKPMYFNGFNAYWLMHTASNSSTRHKVTQTLKEASNYGMNVARTWAFSDGGHRAMQMSPGVYNDELFQGMDFVLYAAKKNGIYLIMSLVNNWEDFGGKKQYVQWARDLGHNVSSDDDFFTNNITKKFYKNHIKAILTRVNSITGIMYKDDPTIFAWELMNEPRTPSELSGKAIQDWIAEMSAYVKSIDKKHLLEIGLEGFYGDSMPERIPFNYGSEVGTDFISNNLIDDIDFATIHFYPDQWVPDEGNEVKAEFVKEWIQSHIQDSKSVLHKPILVTEFAQSSKSSGYNVGVRDRYFQDVYNSVYSCARSGGPCGGVLFWQVMAQGMDEWFDGNEVFLERDASTTQVIAHQSRRMSSLSI